MKKEQLDNTRARLVWLEENGGIGLPFAEAHVLLNEVERLTAREESLVKQTAAQMGVIGRQQEEMDQLRAERDSNREDCAGLVQHNNRQYDEIVALRDARNVAFVRGVEKMRHNLIQRFDWHSYMGDILRSEPVPNDE